MNIIKQYLLKHDFIRTKSDQRVFTSFLSGNYSSTYGTNEVSDKELIENFDTIPDLFIITNFLAKRISKIPVKVVRPSGRDAPNSELWQLIEKPNYYQTWKEFIKTDYGFYNVLGNSYMYGIKAIGFDGMITSVFNLPADRMSIKLGNNKDLPAWQNEIIGYQMDLNGAKYNMSADEVLHNKFFTLRYDSGNWAYGISKYVPGDKINRELKAIYDAKTSIIEKRGAMGILSNESEIPDAEQSRQVQNKLAEYGLSGNQKKIIVTTQKLTWQQMSLNIQELQLIENAKYSFDRLCQMSEFDPVIFSTDGSTFANKAEAIKDLYKNVIKGDVDTLYESINGWISEGYGGDKIVPDWDKVQELESDKKVYTDMLTKQIESAIITPLKANEILYGEGNYDSDNPPPDEYFSKGIKKVNEPEPVEEIVDPALVAELNTEDNG